MSPVKYELAFHISEDNILHSHRRENLRSYMFITVRLSERFAGVILKRGECKCVPEVTACSYVTSDMWWLGGGGVD
jgi:hypothetical protein